VGQINAAVTQLSQTTQQNASSSEELAATAEEMSGQAEHLQQAMSFFKLPGSAHERAAAAVISTASRRSSSQRPGHSAPARKGRAAGKPARAASPFADDVGEVDESNFARF
jgi:methyl-accepting chemotaxis protein